MDNIDAVIIKKCLDGNTEAFSELYGKYKKLIYSVVYRLAEDPQEAGDLTQEAFLKIFKSLYQYKTEYKFSTWAVTITTNLCIDYKKRKRAKTIPLEEIQEVTGHSSTPENEYIKKEGKQKLKNALDALPDMYRTPLILFHQMDMSYEEMTKVLKEPLSIIRNRLYRARLMLKDYLKEERREGIL